MSGRVNLVDAAWMGRSFALDPDLLPPPARPRLLPELVTTPIGEDGVLFVGGERSEVVKGRSARNLLPRVLPLLDGRHTIAELAAATGVGPDVLANVVALLYSRGLLEDGVPARAHGPATADLLSFLGRFIDVSRSNRHREQALERLEQAEVFVAGAPERAAAVAAALRRFAVGRVRIAGIDPAPTRAPDLIVAVASDAADDLGPAIEAAWDADVPCLHVRVGAAGAQIGPLLRRGQTGCYGCFRRLFGVPAGHADAATAGFWEGVAALQVLHYLTRLAKAALHGGVRIYELDAAGELTGEALTAPPVPGCERCGIPGRPLDPADPAFATWAYHTLVRFPGRDLLSPKEHQNHYAIANVQLASVVTAGFASAERVALPPPTGVTGAAPWIAGPLELRDGGIDRATLAALCARTAGWVDDRGHQRRVAPTGGSLGSVELFVVVRDVDGLAPGVYFYNASRHELERLRDLPDAELAAALQTRDELPPCVIVGTGSFAKTQQKYSAFGYRLIYLDAGVATTYVHSIVAAGGLASREYADFDDDQLARAIGLPPSQGTLPTFAIGVTRRAAHPGPLDRRTLSALVPHELVSRCARPGHAAATWPRFPALRPGPDPVLRGLDAILLTRRAVRHYAPRPLDPRVATALVGLATELHHHRVAIGGAEAPVRPLAAIRLGAPGLPPGLYECDRPGHLVARRDGLALDEMRDCVIQNSLAEAPLAIFFLADLERCFARRGARGYRDAAIHAGAMAAQVWLAATSFGLAACAAGGVAPAAISQLSGIDGYHGCALFAIFVGEHAAPPTAASAIDPAGPVGSPA